MTEDTNKEKALQSLEREVNILKNLSHPHVTRLEGFVEDISDYVVWMGFQWEPNGSVRDFIAGADWQLPERISLIDDVALGLEYLHSLNPPIYIPTSLRS